MYDYSSLEIENIPPDVILNISGLEFVKGSNKTNEHKPNRQGNYKQTAQLSESLHLVHEYRPRTDKSIFKIKGSLHKHAQRNNNFRNYTLTDFERTVKELCETLQINPISLRVRCFEFGVNINPSHSANDLLNSIICYKGNEYEKRTYNGKGYLKRFVNAQYDIKIYNKSLQYNLPENILRYEIKVKKMDFVNKKLKHPINTINDLLNPEIIAGLINILIDSIENLYMYDYRINTKQINSKRDKHTLIECINPTFWKPYRETHTPTGYKKKVKRFRELVQKYAPNNLQNELKILIESRCNDLQTVTQNYHYTENATVTHYYPYIVGNNSKLNPRYCATCGREITHQKTNSMFCSEKLYGPNAKRCRNKVSNRKQFEKRVYTGYTLF